MIIEVKDGKVTLASENRLEAHQLQDVYFSFEKASKEEPTAPVARRPVGRPRIHKKEEEVTRRKLTHEERSERSRDAARRSFLRNRELACPECSRIFRGPSGLGAHRLARHRVIGQSPVSVRKRRRLERMTQEQQSAHQMSQGETQPRRILEVLPG